MEMLSRLTLKLQSFFRSIFLSFEVLLAINSLIVEKVRFTIEYLRKRIDGKHRNFGFYSVNHLL